MADPAIPSGPQELTSEWLTQVLREGGAINRAVVKSFDTELIAEGVGLLGQLARLVIRYDTDEKSAPRSLIAKFPADAPENRQTGIRFQFYERENRFYEEVADKIVLGTPRCFYSAMEPDAGQHILLLEDLSAARMGDQLAGCSPAEAELVVREIAKLHASWWESPRLEEVDWIPLPSHPIVTEPVSTSYSDAWDPFVRRFRDRLSPEILHIGERLG